jgi:hypothetical protein
MLVGFRIIDYKNRDAYAITYFRDMLEDSEVDGKF